MTVSSDNTILANKEANVNILQQARDYDSAGFQVIPLSGKIPVVTGVTGRYPDTSSRFPSEGQNIGIRLPKTLIGIDVDAYDGKPGAETLRRLESKFGRLPRSDRSGARQAPSGIYFFRIPEGYESIDALPGIEFIQWFHRFAVVAPSVHPKTKDRYEWSPVGDVPMWLRGPEGFPELPAAWLEGLRKDESSEARSKRLEASEGVLTDGDPCEEVTAVLDRFNDRVRTGESRYSAMIKGQYRLGCLGEEGHPGVSTAMDTLESLYLDATSSESRDTQAEWDRGFEGILRMFSAPESDNDPCDDLEFNLPQRFWEARDSLRQIRQAAHARVVSADAVLYTLLSRMSAMVDHRTRIDTGIGEPAALNLFVAVVGKSGAGKSSSVSVGKKLMPSRDIEGFRDGLPLGSGEGVAQAFYGTVWEDDPTNLKKDGTPNKVRVTKQVRHNVFFSLDEGRALNKMVERNGTTINPTLCSAFVGELLGQANASVETSRIVPAGEYALGLCVGYQMDAAGVLLAEEDSGLPQRFLWANATDPTIPYDRVEHPGELTGYVIEPEAFVQSTDWEPVMSLPADLQMELHRRSVGIRKGDIEPAPELDSHEPLVRAKLAALLALLEGRYTVTQEDWDLSATIWKTSCAVRDSILAHNAAEKAQREEDATRKAVDRERRLELARSQAAPKLDKAARTIARKVHAEGRVTQGKLKQALASADRHLFSEAIDYAEDHGWIRSDDGAFFPVASFE